MIIPFKLNVFKTQESIPSINKSIIVETNENTHQILNIFSNNIIEVFYTTENDLKAKTLKLNAQITLLTNENHDLQGQIKLMIEGKDKNQIQSLANKIVNSINEEIGE